MKKVEPNKQISFENVVWWLLISVVSGFIIGMIIMSGFV